MTPLAASAFADWKRTRQYHRLPAAMRCNSEFVQMAFSAGWVECQKAFGQYKEIAPKIAEQPNDWEFDV